MTTYLTMRVRCPIGNTVAVEECYECHHFEGLSDDQSLIECGYSEPESW